MKHRDYVIVTPARNEEAYIQRTIDAVVAQTVPPRKWVIVSDGSLDGTDDIVARAAAEHPFIELVKFGEPGKPGKKDFGSKVRAFRAGYERLTDIEYQFVGNVDADTTFGPSYFEEILARFESSPQLGLAGGLVWEPDKDGFAPQRTRLNSVCGSVQLFRRDCYEAFGGYIPMRMGGVDAAAEILARKHGWLVRTFPEIPVYAHRRVLTGGATTLHTRYRRGIANYLLGYHPLFQLLSCLSRVGEKPYLVGSVCSLLGYGWSWVMRRKIELPSEVVRFLRAEQMQSLRSFRMGRREEC